MQVTEQAYETFALVPAWVPVLQAWVPVLGELLLRLRA